jgi:2,4-dienoyl-CoA reductase (NADPH2)
MRQHTVDTPYMVGEVHFYTAELEGGLALFDTGPPTPEGRAALLEAVDLPRLRYLFLTHCHIDHYGLANFIVDNSSAVVYAPRADLLRLGRTGEHRERMALLLGDYGFDEGFLAMLRGYVDRVTVAPTRPERWRAAEEAEELEGSGVAWRAFPGHSQSDLAWIAEGEAVTGDILLRGIFQVPLLDVDLEAPRGGRFRNYEAWCASLARMPELRSYKIRPGHRLFVEGVDESIAAYVRTMTQRARQLEALRGLPLPSVIERVFRGRLSDPFHVYLKASEIVFMMDYLENPGLLASSLAAIGLYEALEESLAGSLPPTPEPRALAEDGSPK